MWDVTLFYEPMFRRNVSLLVITAYVVPGSPTFSSDDRGGKFLRNVTYYKSHTASHPRRRYYSELECFDLLLISVTKFHEKLLTVLELLYRYRRTDRIVKRTYGIKEAFRKVKDSLKNVDE
jgi:hypothetical protein